MWLIRPTLITILSGMLMPTVERLMAQELLAPLGKGKLIITEPSFINRGPKESIPWLRFTVRNKTGEAWSYARLRFEINGVCGNTPEHWTVETRVRNLNASSDADGKRVEDLVTTMMGQVEGCRATGFLSVSAFDHLSEQAKDIGERKAIMDDVASRATQRDRELKACAVIYSRLKNKKISDFTIKESRKVEACRQLGIEP